MASTNLIDLLAREFGLVFLPLKEAVGSPEGFQAFMLELGWSVRDIPPPIQNLGTALDQLDAAVDAVRGENASPTDFANVLQAIRSLIDAIDGLSAATFDPELALAGFASTFPRQLIAYLVVEYLTLAHPRVAFLLGALGIIRRTYVPAPSDAHHDHVRRELAWVDFSTLLRDPVQLLQTAFGWRTEQLAHEVLTRIAANLAMSLGLQISLEEIDRNVAGLLENHVAVPGEPARLGTNIILFQRLGAAGELAAGLKLLPLPKDGAALPGFALIPYLTGQVEESVEVDAQLLLSVGSELNLAGGVGIIMRPGTELRVLGDLSNPETSTVAEGNLQLKLVNRDKSGNPILLIGAADGSRLEYKTLAVSAGVLLESVGDADLFAELLLEDAKLVVKASEGDAFLRKILPADGITADFELAPRLSRRQGFHLRGSGGLEISVPAHRSFGPVELRSVTAAVKVRPDETALPITLGATVKVTLGPVTALVENVGLAATFSFPDDNRGNLGPLDIALGFKPPTGIGLSIDGGGFQGGGFLSFDTDKHRYAGVLELTFQEKIALKAIGLLTTRLPDGSPGFSLVISISAEFTPIQLGFGFTLNGVGGLLGLNRTARIERLRTGVKDGTLSSILFPQDVVANADRIISDIEQVFPVMPDRFIFGPMARIGWGTPPLVIIDLGLLIEVPDPIRLVILGVLRALLPAEGMKLLQLQVNFLGVIDFEAEQLAFDASLYDSKLLTYPLAGDMAVRMSWGADKNGLLTVGGFHPDYQPPPMALPDLRRLSLQLLSGDNPRLLLETYFAVTSNTVQFGARLELYAAAGQFNVYGFLSFDVLFQFNPFHLTASVSAMLALRVGSSTIAGITLSLTLDGPTPWHAHGTASFKLCWFITIKVRFDKTFGEERDTRLDDVAVLPLLQAALADKGNWTAELPPGHHRLVSLAQLATSGDQIVADPVGVLTISQKVVPLKIDVQRFGQQRLVDGPRFAIEQVEIGATGDMETLEAADVEEFFAPAQFFERSDAEKLSGKSFERYDAGVRLSGMDVLDADYAAARVVEYELFYRDSQRQQQLPHPRPEPLVLDVAAFHAWANAGAVAASPLSFAGRKKSALAPQAVAVLQEQFVVVSQEDLRPIDAASAVASEAAAYGLMNAMLRDNPALAGRVQVVPAFEVNRT